MVSFFNNAINPFQEVIAYETMWAQKDASFKRIAEIFSKNPDYLPSDIAALESISMGYIAKDIEQLIFNSKTTYNVNTLINGTLDFPEKLRDAKDPLELLYYSGNLNFIYTKSVAIVGTRNPSPEGLRRTFQLVRNLVQDNYTIVSGLAKGIDTQAHTSAIQLGGRTIAVLGTPLNSFYPKENKELQEFIAKNHLLVSQVPFYRYTKQGVNGNKLFFPERNKTMSALTDATIIVEAGETSGTLVQAKAALEQGRKLFILDSCFLNKDITWPEKFHRLGAIRVRTYDDITNVLLNK